MLNKLNNNYDPNLRFNKSNILNDESQDIEKKENLLPENEVDEFNICNTTTDDNITGINRRSIIYDKDLDDEETEFQEVNSNCINDSLFLELGSLIFNLCSNHETLTVINEAFNPDYSMKIILEELRNNKIISSQDDIDKVAEAYVNAAQLYDSSLATDSEEEELYNEFFVLLNKILNTEKEE